MAFIPELINRKTYNEDGVGGMHVYSPWWLDNKKLDFPRGYHIEVWVDWVRLVMEQVLMLIVLISFLASIKLVDMVTY